MRMSYCREHAPDKMVLKNRCTSLPKRAGRLWSPAALVSLYPPIARPVDYIKLDFLITAIR